MKPTTVAALAAAFLPLLATGALAGPIESACRTSGKAGATRALCSCIQQAADVTLSGSDQRRAARFFRNPDMAHATWVSQTAADDAFWDRYKNFGSTAQTYCGG